MTIEHRNSISLNTCQLKFGVTILAGLIRYLHINENSAVHSILLLPVPEESVVGFESRWQQKKGQRNPGHFKHMPEHVIKLLRYE